jgi:hypothetical protein
LSSIPKWKVALAFVLKCLCARQQICGSIYHEVFGGNFDTM